MNVAPRPPENVLIRPLTRADRPAVAFTLDKLSDLSRYQRYLWRGTAESLTNDLERIFSLDHWHHEVLIACLQHPRRPVGLAEYIRHSHRFDSAELALAIVDDCQGRGIGSRLLDDLQRRALAAGVRTITGTALRDNHAALALMKQLGAPALRSDGAITEISVAIDPSRKSSTLRLPLQ